MNLKDFIREVVTTISEASGELQDDLAERGVTLHPPAELSPASGGAAAPPGRRVETISFDLAVAAGEDRDAGAGAIEVVGPGTGGPGREWGAPDPVSRISFSLAIAYPPASAGPDMHEPPRRERPRQKTSRSRKWSRF